LRGGLVELVFDLALNGLGVGLLISAKPGCVGQPPKRLAGALCGDNTLARVHYVVSACCRLLAGFALVSGDCFGNLCHFGRGIGFRALYIIDFFISSFGDVRKEIAKYHYIVMGLLQGFRVGLVLFGDIESLVRALAKRVPDGVGGLALLLDEGGLNGFLQSVVEISEMSDDCSTVSNCLVKNRDCGPAYPLEPNQELRPFTGRVIGDSHLQISSIFAVA
jgi:hypothetical protein